MVARAAGRHPSLFEYVEKNIEKLIRFDPSCIAVVVAQAARLSVDVGGDYGLLRRSAPLPGDIVGDALQLAGRFRAIRYGEARLLGLLAEGYLALQSGILKHSEFDRIRRLAEALPVKYTLGSTKPWDILRALKYDSKAIIRTRKIPLLVRVGEESPGEARDENQLTEAFRWVLEWAHGLSGLRRGGSTS